MHLPVCQEDLATRGWEELDVIFVTGDAYVDHPSFGVPLLARWLEHHGYRVGVIAQPDWRSVEGFKVLGRPRLCFAVSAGAMDSMVAHYTPQRKLRHDDAYTPGNSHGSRPNRATIVYTGRLKEAFHDTPVVIGGIEASLRRFAHYDFWEDKVRRSLLLDSKADLLVYGMGERPLLEIVKRLDRGESVGQLTTVRGTATVQRERPEEALVIPSWEEVASSRHSYNEAFRLQSREQNPYCGHTLAQAHSGRWLVCNPPALPLSAEEMDLLYGLPFTRLPHPSYVDVVPAYEQIRASITTHRGCFGGCSFCAINHHQGKFIQSRSEASIVREIGTISAMSWFRGSISDLGGPTANMYGVSSSSPDICRQCRRESCLWPVRCRRLLIDDRRAAGLLRRARSVSMVKNITVSSGIRYDLLEKQPAYFHELLTHHVGGLLKVAPEHISPVVVGLMRKPRREFFERFLACFREASRLAGKRQAVVPYLMAGHPGTTLSDMADLVIFLKENGLRVEQVQEFTPTPGTRSTSIYYSGMDPDTGSDVEICRSETERRVQKDVLFWHGVSQPERIVAALRAIGRNDVAKLFTTQARKPASKPRGKVSRGTKKT